MEKQAWEELIQRLIRAGILRSPKVIRALRQFLVTPFFPKGWRLTRRWIPRFQ